MKNYKRNNKIKDPILYIIVRPIITLLFKIVFHPKIIDRENIPKNGSIVLGGNHTNNLDCLLLIAATNRKIHFLAKDSLTKGFFGFIFKGMGIIPVNRKIHEGTINRGNNLVLPFKIGCVKMAFDTKSQVVPFVIKGKYNIFGKSVSIKFLEPFTPSDDNLDYENNKFMDLIKNELKKEM